MTEKEEIAHGVAKLVAQDVKEIFAKMEVNRLPSIEEQMILIAEFHGWTKRKIGKGTGQWWWDFGAWGRSNWTSSSFHYFDSWDWIMPVWSKFRDLNIEIIGIHDEEHSKWISALQWYLFSSDEPKRFAERMYYAIKWWNSKA